MILVLAALAVAALVIYLGHRAPRPRPEYRPYLWRTHEPPSNVTLPWEKPCPFRLVSVSGRSR